MSLKRFISEPVIIGFVALVDLSSVLALIVCHRDVTRKEAQAAVEMQVHEAVSARKTPGSAEMTHYAPATINAMLHPATDDKFKDVSRRISSDTR